MMRKIVALWCVLALVISFAGCNRKNTRTASTTTWVEEESGAADTQSEKKTSSSKGSSSRDEGVNTGANTVIDNPLKANLQGATVTIYETGAIFSAQTESNKSSRVKQQIIAKLQKALNCKLKVNLVDNNKLNTLVSSSAASGKGLCNIIAPELSHAGTYIASNTVANLKKISSLDLTKDYMNRYGVLNATQFGSAKYGVGLEGKNRTSLVLFNKRILKEIGYKENYIYDLVNSGKWTFEAYRKLAKKAVKDLDGKPGLGEKDQFGQTIQDASTKMVDDILSAYGTSMLKVNGSGQLTNNMSDAKILKTATLAQDIIINDGTNYNSGNWETNVKFFGAGKSLFLYCDASSIHMLTSMSDDFGAAPAPQVSASTKYLSAMNYNCRVMMIPAGLSAKEQYNSGAVMQAFSYLLDEYFTALESDYTNRYFCDKTSAKCWKMADSGMTAMPHQCYASMNEAIKAGTYRVFWDAVNPAKRTSPAAVIESTRSSVNKELTDLNKKIKDK